MSKSFKKLVSLVAVVATTSLVGCLDGSESEQDVLVLPQIGIGFPSTNAEYATDGASLTLSGIALSTAAQARPNSVTLEVVSEDEEVQVGPVFDNPDGTSNFFYWLLSSGDILKAGLNFVDVLVDASSGTVAASRSVVRGTSYMAETAIGYDSLGDRWFVLDAGARELLVQTLPQLPDVVDDTTPINEKQLFPDTNAAGDDVIFERPVDFAIDTANQRILLLDNSESPRLIEIALADGDRNVLSGIGLSDPVAIAVDNVNSTAYVLQGKDRSIVEINLLDDTVVVASPFMPVPSIALQNPQDMVFQPAGVSTPNRLIISDRRFNLGTVDSPFIVALQEQDALVVIDLDNANAASLLLDAEECQSSEFSIVDCDDDPETGPLFVNGNLSNMALDGDSLFVLDAGLGGVIEVDVSGGSGEGQRLAFSTAFTFDEEGELCVSTADEFCAGLFNPFAEPIALATGDNRLLVLDNGLGSVVEIDISTGDSRGERRFILGGRTLSGSPSMPEGGVDEIIGIYASFHIPPGGGLFGDRMVDLIELGSGVATTILPDENAIASLSFLPGGGVSLFTQSPTLDEDSNIEDVTLETTFSDPRVLSADFSAGYFYIFDVETNRLIAQPLTASAGERIVASDDTNTVTLSDPINTTLIIADVEDDAAPETRLYVLDRALNDVVSFDLDIAYADANEDGFYSLDDSVEWFTENLGQNRILLSDEGLTPCFSSPQVMLPYRYDPDEEVSGDELDYLFIVDSDASVSLLELPSYTCSNLAYSTAPAGVNIVDAAWDFRLDNDLENPEPAILLLDEEGTSIWQARVTLNPTAPGSSEITDPVLLSSTASGDGENQPVSPDKLFFISTTNEAYIWDGVLKTFFIADLAPRDLVTGEIVEGGIVSGRRLVAFRSVAMNCNPELDTASTLTADNCAVTRPAD